MRWVVDDHLAIGRSDGLFRLACLYLAASALAQGLTFAYGYLAATVAQHVLSALRVRLFAHIQRLPASYFDRTPLGDVISRCTADIETLDAVFTSGVATLVANLFRLVTIAISMVVLNVQLSLVAAFLLIPLVLLTRFFQVRIRKAEQANRVAIGAMNTQLQETLTGVEVIQAFGREPTFVARFRRVLRRVLDAYRGAAVYSATYPSLTGLTSWIIVAALLWFGTSEVFGDFGVSLGTLTAFALLMQRFFTPLVALGDEWQTVQTALSGAERIFRVLALPEDSSVDDVGVSQSNGIECDGVTFGYSTGQAVLRGVDLRVVPGEHVSLVGRTGAGKTSVVHLLAGLYAPWSGDVRIAGRDPRALTEDERRRVFGLVPQVTQLFTGTVLENLTLRDESVSEQDAVEAARVSGADPFISRLPDGYHTVLRGSGLGAGVQLSAGQEQLLALTRALVWRPPVLLLDEATSVVDGASDAALRAALRERVLPGGTAVLTIAHRLATAAEADRVIVLERGRVAEEGSPSDLIARGGRFAALLELEAAGWDWRSNAAVPSETED